MRLLDARLDKIPHNETQMPTLSHSRSSSPDRTVYAPFTVLLGIPNPQTEPKTEPKCRDNTWNGGSQADDQNPEREIHEIRSQDRNPHP